MLGHLREEISEGFKVWFVTLGSISFSAIIQNINLILSTAVLATALLYNLQKLRKSKQEQEKNKGKQDEDV